MLASDRSGQVLPKKAYEISYALFRVAASSKKRSFMEHLERQGLSFLASAVRGDYPVAQEAIKAIEYLLRLGEDVGIVNAANVRTIIGELELFDAAIAGLGNTANPEEVDLNNIFSELPITYIQENQPVASKETNDENANTSHSTIKAAMRQSAILERIRQNGNCRLKDLQEALPETSERTVRYDLQNLLGRGLVERVGNGGPATFYRAR